MSNEPLSYFQRLQKIKLNQLPKEAVAKKKKPLKKVSDKMAAENKMATGDNALDLWFDKKRKQCKGVCFLCGGSTLKSNDDEYRRSIHHLLDKRKGMFPSVSTHEDNWLEVCFYGNSCHTNIHNGKITWELLKDSKEWDVIKEKLLNILPMVAESEKKNKLYDKLLNLVYGK
jgi:hypothetical protein